MRAWLLLGFMVAPMPTDEGPKVDPIASAVRDTQLTLVLSHGGKQAQLQGTVISKDEAIITVMTAGHGLGPADAGALIRLQRGGKSARARVESVVRNPSYRPLPSSDIPGADNAVARFRLEPGGSLSTDMLLTAELAAWAIPEPTGRTLTVGMIDQFGHSHTLKAGNYSNPRWLEWGPTYRPAPGDSGSGVFVLRIKPDGTSGPVLIGVVVDRSDRGGGASLVHERDPWIKAATKPIQPR